MKSLMQEFYMSHYIKKCSLLSLLVFSSPVSADSWLETFWHVLMGTAVQESVERPTSPKSTELEKEINDYIDFLLDTSGQRFEVRRFIQEKKSSFIHRIVPQIENMHHLSDIEKVQRAQQEAHAWILQLIADQSNEYATQHIQRIHYNPPVNPSYLKRLSDRDVARNTTNEMLQEAQEKAENSRYGALKDYIGDNLNKKVRFVVEREFGVYGNQTPAAAMPAYCSPTSRPSAPPMESAPAPTSRPLYPDLYVPSAPQAIYEVYPEFVSDERNVDFHQRREQGKLYRDARCVVCFEKYERIGKRVNLFCGHSICPTCLYMLIYQARNKKCPKCRAEIRIDEFPKQVLNPDLN
jgi:hypothetical protein